MKTQVFLACLLLTTGSAFAQTATIQFHREGDKLIVTQNGTDSTVNAASNNDFIVPVPDTSAPAPQPPAPVIEAATPTITAAPAPSSKVPERVKPVRPPKEQPAPPDESQPSVIQSSSQPLGHGGGVIISPSSLPDDSLPSLPASDMAPVSTSHTVPPPAPLVKPPAAAPSETALSIAERRELNMYRTMLASPLRLTIDNGAVTVKWNSAHGTVTIPDSHQVDIKLDRVIQTPTR
jgi:hypothetical protein